MDYLTKQAPEILAMIFKEVHTLNGEQQMLGAISKQLLPYTRQNLYRSVHLKSCGQAEEFIATIDSRLDGNTNGQYLGSLVESLHVETWSKHSWETEPFQPLGLFINLINLKNLSIGNVTGLHDFVLSWRIAGRYLPRLESLDLWDLAGGEMHPLDPERFRLLSRLNALTSLAVIVSDEDEYPRPVFELHRAPQAANFHLPRITTLVIGGGTYALKKELTIFMTMFNNLCGLYVEDIWGVDALAGILGGYVAPLTVLGLARGPYECLKGEPEWKDYIQLLARTPNLICLRLSGKILGLDTLSYLQSLQDLKELILTGELGLVTLEHLRPLIEPRARPGSLTLLVFDYLNGKQGRNLTHLNIMPKGQELECVAEGEYGWTLPDWPPFMYGPYTFHIEDAESFLSQASQCGLEVRGTFVEAVEVQQEFDRQRKEIEGNIGKSIHNRWR